MRCELSSHPPQEVYQELSNVDPYVNRVTGRAAGLSCASSAWRPCPEGSIHCTVTVDLFSYEENFLVDVRIVSGGWDVFLLLTKLAVS